MFEMVKPTTGISEGEPARRTGLDLTIVLPTLNESENVGHIVDLLHTALDARANWEVVFVDDDSPDGTAEIVKAIATTDPRVRCIHRIGRRGLSTACIEGVLSSAADYIAVMDADMQHDERILPEMLDTAKRDDVDVVVGSRYVEGGGLGEWDESRVRVSKFATRMASLATKVRLTDPMSGFFLMRRPVFNALTPHLSGMGFKILLDLFASSPQPLSFRELPYEFRARQHGESKLDSQAAWDFLMLLADKTVGKYVPVRFISFAVIGGFGVFVHLATFYALFTLAAQTFAVSKLGAVVLSMVSNFALNNRITYRDRRLKGWRWVRGLVTFALVCSVGAVADIGISSYLYDSGSETSFLHLHTIFPVLAGVLVGSVWNYALSSIYTWKK